MYSNESICAFKKNGKEYTLPHQNGGIPKKDKIRNKKQYYIDEAERVEVERRFSLTKRKCGMGLIMTRLSETAKRTIALSMIVLNLRKVLCSFLKYLLFY